MPPQNGVISKAIVLLLPLGLEAEVSSQDRASQRQLSVLILKIPFDRISNKTLAVEEMLEAEGERSE